MGVYLDKAMQTTRDSVLQDFPIRFTANTDLSVIEKSITDQILMYEVPEETEHKSNLHRIHSAIKNLPMVQEELEELIINFSSILINSFEQLKNSIAPEVESLYSEITEVADRQSDMLQRDAPSSEVSGVNLILVDLPSTIASIDNIDTIRSIVHEYFNISSDSVLEINALRAWGNLTGFEWPTVEHGQYFQQTFISNICKELSDDSEDNRTRVLKIVNGFNVNSYYKWASLNYPQLQISLNIIQETLPILPAIVNALDSVPEQYMEAFHTWLERVKIILDLAAYTLYCIHTNTDLGRSLIYSPELINATKFVEFEENGGTLSDIQKIINVFYTDNPLMREWYGSVRTAFPNKGISLERVVSEVERAELHIATATAAFNRRYDLNRKLNLSMAMGSVLRAYVEDFDELLPNFDNLEHMKLKLRTGFIPAYVKMFQTSDKESMEHFLYLFLLRLRHPGDIIETIYTRLGSAYSGLIDDGSDFNSSNQILLADVSILAELLTEFIVSETTTVV